MHLYYEKYLQKLKNEIDRLIIKEVEADDLDPHVEHCIKILFANHKSAEKCLHKEMAEENRPATMATRV